MCIQRGGPLASEVLLEKGKTKGRLADAVVSWKSAGGNGVPAGLVNDGHHLLCVEQLSMLYMLCRSDTRRTLTCYGAEELEELSW